MNHSHRPVPHAPSHSAAQVATSESNLRSSSLIFLLRLRLVTSVASQQGRWHCGPGGSEPPPGRKHATGRVRLGGHQANCSVAPNTNAWSDRRTRPGRARSWASQRENRGCRGVETAVAFGARSRNYSARSRPVTALSRRGTGRWRVRRHN